ncbi:hypothetical protein CRENBAI_011959 [Crenichthys baileyi]|uniref:Uncharacterized protein n=1 Tax=Crenichthys baileyi TaxID=28760 RepID=A0AAV9SE89_9TELE
MLKRNTRGGKTTGRRGEGARKSERTRNENTGKRSEVVRHGTQRSRKNNYGNKPRRSRHSRRVITRNQTDLGPREQLEIRQRSLSRRTLTVSASPSPLRPAVNTSRCPFTQLTCTALPNIYPTISDFMKHHRAADDTITENAAAAMKNFELLMALVTNGVIPRKPPSPLSKDQIINRLIMLEHTLQHLKLGGFRL